MGDKLRWGILGTSAIARQQIIPAIRESSNGVVVAIGGRDLARTRVYAEKFGIPRVVDGYQALIVDPEIDAVYVPLPNSAHAEWTIAAAQSGKAILCEKPLAVNGDDAKRVVEECERLSVPLMEAFMYRFHPQNDRVMELIGQNEIGEIREVRAHLSVTLAQPPAPTGIRFNAATGGGVLLDAGCYPVNIVRRVFGSEPQSVQSTIDMREDLGVEFGAAALLNYSDGRVGIATCSYRAGGQGTYTVVGTKGTIEVPRAILIGYGSHAPEGMVIVMDTNGNRREESIPPANHYRIMVEAFAAAVLAGMPVPFHPSDGVRNLRVLDAIAKSGRTGKAEPVFRD